MSEQYKGSREVENWMRDGSGELLYLLSSVDKDIIKMMMITIIRIMTIMMLMKIMIKIKIQANIQTSR